MIVLYGMIDFYVKRIDKGIMTVEEVPSLWRARVEKAFEELEVQGEEIQHEERN